MAAETTVGLTMMDSWRCSPLGRWAILVPAQHLELRKVKLCGPVGFLTPSGCNDKAARRAGCVEMPLCGVLFWCGRLARAPGSSDPPEMAQRWCVQLRPVLRAAMRPQR